MNYNESFRKRTKKLAIDIIQILSPLPYSDTLSIIRKQLIRSATSTAANYRAMGRARSSKERFSKLSITIEEADETLFWLEIFEELQFIDNHKLKNLINETEEIVKALATYRKKLSQ
ncbi:MAG: four helix bundle protein [Moheibacter sp.]